MAYFIRFQTGFKFNIDKYLITLIVVMTNLTTLVYKKGAKLTIVLGRG